jgi:uncharacterized protein (TIGR04255 family)
MNLPKRINPCPIIDSVVELRFESNFPIDAIFGVIFSAVKNEYAGFQRLPVSEVPEIIRNQDLNLKYAPFFQASSSSFVLRVGPRVVALSNIGEYVGWDKFFLKLKELLGKLRGIEVVSKFTRIGIRYIDFFESDIFNNVNLIIPEIQVNQKLLSSKQRAYRALVENDKFLTNIQMANNTDVIVKANQKKGSLLDSDTYFESAAGFGFAGLEELIGECHLRGKEMFFSLLKEDFIRQLNPEY